MPNAGTLEDYTKWLDELHRPFFEPIGRLIVAYGAFEHTIDNHLRILEAFGNDHAGRVIPAALGSSARKTSVLEELLSVRLPDEQSRKRLKAVMTEVSELRSFRNKVVHGPLRAFYEDQGRRIAQKSWTNPHNYKMQFINFGVDDILEATEGIWKAKVEISDLMKLKSN